MNRVILTGRLATDPELHYTQTGRARMRFNIAVDHQYRDQDNNLQKETFFIPIVVWGAQAESCANFLRKGRLVAVDGRLRIDTFETQEGERKKVVEVIAQQVESLGGGPTEVEEKLLEEPEYTDEEVLSEASRGQAMSGYHLAPQVMHCWNCKTSVPVEAIWDKFDKKWYYRCPKCGYLIGSHR